MKSSKKKILQFSPWQVIALTLGVALLTFWSVKFLDNSGLPQIPGRSRLPQIQAAQFKEALANKDFTLVNVHTPYEGEIAKTDVFIDYDKIEENKDKLPKDKNAKIILYCLSGRMSETAGEKLISLGYTNVSHLSGGIKAWEKAGERIFNVEKLQEAVLPEDGFSLPINWGKIGPSLVSGGVIDLAKFKEAVRPNEEELLILTQESDKPLSINSADSQFVVDILWALGLAQKSKVYTEGPMGKEYKDRAGNFASTGGWSLAKGPATNYLGKDEIIKLTPDDQDRVFEITKNIYRPCCGNPTSFPDCNHGMAALGLVELLVAQKYSDEEIYRAVLGFNSFWFGQSYITLAAHYALQGIPWDKVDAKEALGQGFSSGQGAAKVSQEIGRLPYLYKAGGGGCGV